MSLLIKKEEVKVFLDIIFFYRLVKDLYLLLKTVVLRVSNKASLKTDKFFCSLQKRISHVATIARFLVDGGVVVLFSFFPFLFVVVIYIPYRYAQSS